MSRSNLARVLSVAVVFAGVWYVSAADAPKPVTAASPAFKPGSVAYVTHALSQPCGLENTTLENASMGELFEMLGQKHNLTIRLDPERFNKFTGHTNLYETKLDPIRLRGLTLRDVIDEVCAQLSEEPRAGYTVRAGQIVIGNSFVMPSVPGSYKRGVAPMMIPESLMAKMLYGPTVNLAVQEKSLTEIVSLLREQSGVNIVIDPKLKDLASKRLTLTLADPKLWSVLKVISEMSDAAPAVMDNIFFITTPCNASKIMAETELNLGLRELETQRPPVK